MKKVHKIILMLAVLGLAAFGIYKITTPKMISFGVIGMGEGAVNAMKAGEEEMNIKVIHFQNSAFMKETVPDFSKLGALVTSFSSGEYAKQYSKAVSDALKVNKDLKVFCAAPPHICGMWSEWLGKEVVTQDPQVGKYYGLSNESMKDMLQYILVKYLGRKGKITPPGAGNPVKVYHPDYEGIQTVKEFLDQAEKKGLNTRKMPRIAIGSWRHHILYHQPKVINSLIAEIEKQGMIGLCLAADDVKFKERLMEFKPDLVIMTSHTREPAKFWEKLGVPRLHALWFMEESIAQWEKSDTTGMNKGELFHLLTTAELKGATETLASGGTLSGKKSNEEITPIPDRIERIVSRAKSWINLRNKKNSEKKLAVMIYDREADKAGIMSGPSHNLNAPVSMMEFLSALKKAGYNIKNMPKDTDDLIKQVLEYGRQMGVWEPAMVNKLAESGKAVLVSAEEYEKWVEEKIPERRKKELFKQWGPPPGNIMVWENKGEKFFVLPMIDLGNVKLITQPLKGETLTASLSVQTPDETLLPPTHNYLATYFWIQKSMKADAVVHFGAHGSEWLYPGKLAAISKWDWIDMLIENLPNINPWLASNITELLPAKRKARAVTIDFLPSLLMETGLSDELRNLESAINKYKALDPGSLKTKFAASITKQAEKAELDRDLEIQFEKGKSLSEEDVLKISKYIHDLTNEYVPADMHVLGKTPDEKLLVSYLVYSMGKRYLKAAAEIYGNKDEKPDNRFLKNVAEKVIRSIVHGGLSLEEALKKSGADLPENGVPEIVKESFDMAVEMFNGIKDSSHEITNILDALNGKFILPGPSGNPERNPGIIPTGRNMFLLNPQELPSKTSWELGTKLISEYLENEKKIRGRYPKKIAFSLVPFATYNDFGIIESQVLYLMGVRPVWDAKNRVRDVELIPSSELGRPRIDVFLSPRSIYREELPSLMKLLDKAIRMVTSLDEKDNWVYENSQKMKKTLIEKGFNLQKAEALSKARMYGAKPEEILDSHDWFFYLTERTGEWDTREDLLEVYLENNRFVYAKDVWGEKSPDSFNLAVEGTELILRSWNDNRDFGLSNKFSWWVDGTLSLAIKHITGKEPEYKFVDVRDTDEAGIVDSKEVVQRDFRARVTNPRWIKNMMDEGYAGATAITGNINNMLGWSIMRKGTIQDSNWKDVTDVYVRDSKNLNITKWFDKTNPFAFQQLAVTLIETVRKGFWDADIETQQEIVKAYTESVAKHGKAGGAKEGGNVKLEEFVENILEKSGKPEMKKLLEKYREKNLEEKTVPEKEKAGKKTEEKVEGKKLEKKDDITKKKPDPYNIRFLYITLAAFILVIAGFMERSIRNRRKWRK